MLKRLKRRFVLLSALCVLLFLVVIVVSSYALSYQKLVGNADAVIASLYDGVTGRPSHVNTEVSAQAADARYFLVTMKKDGAVFDTDMTHILSVDAKTSEDMARQVFQSGQMSGFFGEYRYQVKRTERFIYVLFLARGRSLETFYDTQRSILVISCAAFVCVLFLLIFFSERIVRPVVRSDEKQKQFISAAGHQIKTPLTVIDADAELLKMDVGANEWLEDIFVQTKRMTEMTNELISLSKMDEDGPLMARLPFSLSEVAEEALHAFEALAQKNARQLDAQIHPCVTLTGDERAVRQLLMILLDNAFKYADGDGKIVFSVTGRGHTAYVSVENPAKNVTAEQASHFFDRFYRGANAQKSGVDGHGLGLSVARAVAEAHGGKIGAALCDNGNIKITAVLKSRG